MRRLLAFAAPIAAVLVAAPAALTLGIAPSPLATMSVAITSPADGAHSLTGTVQVDVDASASAGVYGVQLNVDGVATGPMVTTTVGQYQYAIPWDTSGVALGWHTLTVTAMDWSQPYPNGNLKTSDPITVDVGPPYPSISLGSPKSWTFVRGTTAITASATSAVDPTTVSIAVDGTPLAVTGPPWTATWDTNAAVDGSHVVTATVVDGRGKTATDSANVTVDNTPPSLALDAPAPGSFALGTLAAQATASDAYGIASVQFAIDGTPAGLPVTQPDSAGAYTYSALLDISSLAAGSTHTLTAIAADNAGNTSTTAPVSFTVGAGPPAVAVTVPPDWTYGRGVTPVTVTVTGGQAPVAVRLSIDGTALPGTLTAAPYTWQWTTTSVADGTHLLTATATDALNRTSTSAAVHVTVDNTAPTGFWIAPAAGTNVTGVTTLQAHGSDAYGVRSVQFLVDGQPVGAPVTSTSSPYAYSLSWDPSTVAAGTHTLSATVTDNAGNTTTLTPTPVTTGPLQYLPVLNYHEINPPDGYTIYDETPAQADAELAYLKANGYQSVTLEQYQAWLGGAKIGIAKPVLITVDDGLKDEQAWDPLLQKYGFKAVMFVVTGLADDNQPAGSDPNNMSWSDIEKLATNGRWEIALHAGQYGHGEYDSKTKIGSQTYSASCPYFYSCLSYTTSGKKTTYETVAAYETAVENEVTKAIAELKQKVPTASTIAWAAPFNDAGQWTNLYNDPSGQAQAWMPGYFASLFPIVFTQTDPVTYAQASGTVGSLTGFDRHYRFEVHTHTTIAQFAAALADPAFAR